ncbi:Protein crumbs -like protein 3 Precursor [Channa argus]|uniref:Protein crumbs-like protein 3 n=1 Tax=Channa argus TaxID=215402 RepID=A0A6G1QBP6_CHAAH|nr:Protein crumbs -like protein 3 Precursor [Channa argus]
MALCADVLAIPGIVVGTFLLLVLSSNPVWAIVAPTVTLGVLVIILAVLGWLFCVVKKKRQTEGTYRPSAEEQSGARSVAAPDAIKLPKEERLI